MFADDTQLFNKNDESVKKSFDILTPFTNPFWSECINFGKTTFNLSARIFAIIL
jgi:hypothetical protein